MTVSLPTLDKGNHMRTARVEYPTGSELLAAYWGYLSTGGLILDRDGAERQAGFAAERFCLKPVRVEVFAQKFVFFNLDPDATPLAEIAGDLAADMMAEIPRFDDLVPNAPRPSRPMAANWKVVLDNFHECYHCGPSHQGKHRLI